MSKLVYPHFYLERIVNASPFSNQTPTIDNSGFYYDEFTISGASAFAASGYVRGIIGPDQYKLLIMALDAQNDRWYSGPQNWTATIDPDGAWRLGGITTTALSYAAVLMTPEFFTEYTSAQFPQGNDGFVTDLPTAVTNPGQVILQITFPPGFNRSLSVEGQIVAPGAIVSGGKIPVWPSTYGPTSPTDPLALSGGDLQTFFLNWRNGYWIRALDQEGQPTGWTVKLGFYAAAQRAPLYFLVLAGLDGAQQAPANTPIIRGTQLGLLGDNDSVSTTEISAELTITVLAENFEIRILSDQLEPSLLSDLAQMLETIGKELFKIVMRCAMM